MSSRQLLTFLGLCATSAFAARQPYDVRKIIEAFRNPYDDLTMLCAHRGLRFNGTAENSVDAYFRAAQAGLECIETDILLSKDFSLPLIHDSGLGRTTDVGEVEGKPAYSPYTGEGYNPKVAELNYDGYMDGLHLRDEQGRARAEYVPTLPDMVQHIHDQQVDVVLQLDFKDIAAVEPAYWALKTMTNSAGVPANEWCIYKLQAKWYKTPEEFEALPWVQDAFESGIHLAFIPVYNPEDEAEWDTLGSIKSFSMTNYTISAEVEKRSDDGQLENLHQFTKRNTNSSDGLRTAGTYFVAGDFIEPSSDLTSFDTGNFTFPDDISVNGSVWGFSDDETPSLVDSSVTEEQSKDGHDYRQDFDWIVEQKYNWVITDTPDVWSDSLGKQGLRNIKHMIADGKEPVSEELGKGWYRRHARDIRMQ